MRRKENIGIRFLYRTLPGRVLLKGLTRPCFSRTAGYFLDSPCSKWMIPGFIRRNNIYMGEYEKRNYPSFNDFFKRRLLPGRRGIDGTKEHLISPCDGLLTVYKINRYGRICIKHSWYGVENLLEDTRLAGDFEGGLCFVFRLRPSDYHHYCYVDNGTVLKTKKISGILHCVRPIASEEYPVYIQNCREYTVIHSENFGKIVQMEIGALLVGKINNRNLDMDAKRGMEKGYFEFGGSTIVLLTKAGQIEPASIKRKNPMSEEVRLGEKIAERGDNR